MFVLQLNRLCVRCGCLLSTPRILHSSAQTISPQYPSNMLKKSTQASSIWFILAKLLNKSCLLGFHATLPNDTTATWCPTAKIQSLWHIHTYLISFKSISSKHKGIDYFLGKVERWGKLMKLLKSGALSELREMARCMSISLTLHTIHYHARWSITILLLRVTALKWL